MLPLQVEFDIQMFVLYLAAIGGTVALASPIARAIVRWIQDTNMVKAQVKANSKRLDGSESAIADLKNRLSKVEARQETTVDFLVRRAKAEAVNVDWATLQRRRNDDNNNEDDK